jgi:DNA-binding transcriptional regulator YdaS (Cro superfamily)
MDKKEAIKLAGSASALAAILGVSRSAVSQWIHIPKARLWQLKAMRPEWFL